MDPTLDPDFIPPNEIPPHARPEPLEPLNHGLPPVQDLLFGPSTIEEEQEQEQDDDSDKESFGITCSEDRFDAALAKNLNTVHSRSEQAKSNLKDQIDNNSLDVECDETVYDKNDDNNETISNNNNTYVSNKKNDPSISINNFTTNLNTTNSMNNNQSKSLGPIMISHHAATIDNPGINITNDPRVLTNKSNNVINTKHSTLSPTSSGPISIPTKPPSSSFGRTPTMASVTSHAPDLSHLCIDSTDDEDHMTDTYENDALYVDTPRSNQQTFKGKKDERSAQNFLGIAEDNNKQGKNYKNDEIKDLTHQNRDKSINLDSDSNSKLHLNPNTNTNSFKFSTTHLKPSHLDKKALSIPTGIGYPTSSGGSLMDEDVFADLDKLVSKYPRRNSKDSLSSANSSIHGGKSHSAQLNNSPNATNVQVTSSNSNSNNTSVPQQLAKSQENATHNSDIEQNVSNVKSIKELPNEHLLLSNTANTSSSDASIKEKKNGGQVPTKLKINLADLEEVPRGIRRQATRLEEYAFPTHRLQQTLQDENKYPLVIVACGSFSPITYLHLRMFEMAIDAVLEHTRFEVVGGYYSPVSDNYKKPGLAAAHHRVRMCELACERTSSWLMVDAWESLQTAYTRTAVVLDHFNEEINIRRGGILSPSGERRKVRIMLLAGGDLIESMGEPNVWADEDLHHILGWYGCLIVERTGSDVRNFLLSHDIMYQHRRNVLVIKQLIYNDISSTKVRLFIRRGMSVQYLLPNSVIRYIEKHQLYFNDSEPVKMVLNK